MIAIDYQDKRPLYEQVAEKMSLLILGGALAPDSQLPSVRQLAMTLSINPNTVARAYAELERQGYIYPVKGRGNFVSPAIRVEEEKQQRCLAALQEALVQGVRLGVTEEACLALVRGVYHPGGLAEAAGAAGKEQAHD